MMLSIESKERKVGTQNTNLAYLLCVAIDILEDSSNVREENCREGFYDKINWKIAKVSISQMFFRLEFE